MGSDNAPHLEDGEGPVREAALSRYFIAPTAVSNEEFAEFVKATGYVCDAKRNGGSFVFSMDAIEGGDRLQHAPWWQFVNDVDWSNPAGDGSVPIPDHPVIHVSHNDACVYASWLGCSLPTEAQWEFAARGRLQAKPYPWGDALLLDGQHRCNIWQGEFPNHNSREDGFEGIAPVASFSPNNYGLYNMTGNTWEWCADRFSRLHSPKPCIDPVGPLSGNRFVLKGGSFLCHDSYCSRYRTSSRTANVATATAANISFRLAR